jgi:hypothetical protein
MGFYAEAERGGTGGGGGGYRAHGKMERGRGFGTGSGGDRNPAVGEAGGDVHERHELCGAVETTTDWWATWQ